MIKAIKYTLFVVIGLIICYACLSWFLLDGKFSYTTSYNEPNINTSKEKGIFSNSDLKVLTEGDSLVNWEKVFDIWTNKRNEITYYGFILHHTTTKPYWRYLNIKFKDGMKKDNWCIKNDNESFFSECCNRIGCNVNDTISISFYEFKEKRLLGKLKVIIK